MNNDAPENFFRRWARRKAESDSAPHVAPAKSLPVARSPGELKLSAPPTLADVGILGPDANYSGFIASGLDRTVHRAAMKKLFSDPHFNRMDGLDIYIDDYTKPSPVSAAMLACLAHAKSTLDPTPAWCSESADKVGSTEASQVGNMIEVTAPAGSDTGGSGRASVGLRTAFEQDNAVADPSCEMDDDWDRDADKDTTRQVLAQDAGVCVADIPAPERTGP